MAQALSAYMLLDWSEASMCVESQILLSSILPSGKGCVLVLKLYADESIDSQTSLMNVSGYLMTEDQFSALDEGVKRARGSLPYFHMKERHHLKYPEIYQSLVNLITPNSVLYGFSASLDVKEHEFLMSHKFNERPLRYWMGKPYTYAVGQVMGLCSEYLSSTKYKDNSIAYVFENGHPNEGDADFFWSQLATPRYAEEAAYYRYASHTFVNGKGPLGSVLQLCDILAWNINRWRRKGKQSAELQRLFKTPTLSNHHDRQVILKTIEIQIERWRARELKKYGNVSPIVAIVPKR